MKKPQPKSEQRISFIISILTERVHWLLLSLKDTILDMSSASSKVVPIHVTCETLLRNLKATLIGRSSSLHTWDKSRECFVLAGLPDTCGVLVIEGMDADETEKQVGRVHRCLVD